MARVGPARRVDGHRHRRRQASAHKHTPAWKVSVNCCQNCEHFHSSPRTVGHSIRRLRCWLCEAFSVDGHFISAPCWSWKNNDPSIRRPTGLPASQPPSQPANHLSIRQSSAGLAVAVSRAGSHAGSKTAFASFYRNQLRDANQPHTRARGQRRPRS